MTAKILKAALFAAAGISAEGDEFLGDSRRLAAGTCAEKVLDIYFGNNFKKQITIKAGSQGGEMDCPKESAIPGGKIKYTCGAGGGTWSTEIGCFDCPALGLGMPEKVSFEDHIRSIIAYPGVEGDTHKENCEFQDGKKYKHGAIIYKCMNGAWKMEDTTCTDTPCPTGKATIDFGGGLGPVEFGVVEGSGTVNLLCPSDAPNPSGQVQLQCTPPAGGSQDVGKWEFVSQTCQLCSPMTVEVQFEQHKMKLSPGGGALNDVFSTPCAFEDATYDGGKISYKCFQEGWKLFEASCENYFCPEATMIVHMRYHENDQNVHATSSIKVPGHSKPGTYEVSCPVVSKNGLGKVTVECMQNGGWKLIKADCTGEVLERLSA